MYSENRLSYNRKEAGGWQARLKIRGIHYIYIIYLAEPFIQSIPFKVYFFLFVYSLGIKPMTLVWLMFYNMNYEAKFRLKKKSD